MNERILTVSELNGYVKRLLDTDVLLSGIWLKGEISNFKNHSSGHLYMSLKDGGGTVRAVMFKSAALRLKFQPSDGMKVMVFGRVSVFESAGQYQVYIEAMQPEGVGALYVAYEQLKAKLEQEGLFSAQYKKPIPSVPSKIAVVTSPTGAAVRDVLHVLNRRFPFAQVVVCPVLVQGDMAAEQIARAIDYVNEAELADVMIVGRGGGSIEDLWAFNEEVVARAVFRSAIPIISAVGHETDFTICDFVADLRAPTPSAAAELAVPSLAEIKSNLAGTSEWMRVHVMHKLEALQSAVQQLSVRLSPESILAIYDKKRLVIDSKVKLMQNHAEKKLAGSREKFAFNAAKLHSLSPLRVLSRGFSVMKTESGKVVKTVSDVQIGDSVTTVLADGAVSATVTQTERNNEDGRKKV